MNLIIISISIVIILAIVFIVYTKRKPKESTTQAPTEPENELRNFFGKKSFKLISYEEALEASKQFIYNISRAVMQRFTPDAKKELSELGRRLFQAGAQYIHVVDIFGLTVEKQRAKAMQSKEQQKIRSAGINK